MKKNYTLILIALVATVSASAQVTIGLDKQPIEGALLDLQNKKNIIGGVTADKGLGLPRVDLITTNKLYPMFAEGDDNYSGAKIAIENNNHIGLILYNTNKCLHKGYGEGLYVWSGVEWEFLGDKKASLEIITDKDQDGNLFNARRFGDAGVWMIDNLAAITYPNGGNIPKYEGIANYTAYYCYPSSKPAGWDTEMPDVNTPNGVLYTSFAARKSASPTPTFDQGQVAGGTPGANEVEMTISGDGPDSRGYYYIQGVCPIGWHLPSDREWNRLEKELFEHADKYSHYDANQLPGSRTWNVDWEIQAGNDRGGATGLDVPAHGAVMKSGCSVIGGTDKPKGMSLYAFQGGFDAPLVGRIIGGLAVGYNSQSFFWTSSISATGIWARGITSSYQNVSKTEASRRGLMSVRCVMTE